jgi:hypothetical protein
MIEATAFETRSFLFDAVGETSDGDMLNSWAIAQGAPAQMPVVWKSDFCKIAFSGKTDLAAANLFFHREERTAMIGGLISNPSVKAATRKAAAIFVMDRLTRLAQEVGFDVVLVKAASPTDESLIRPELDLRERIQRDANDE